MRRFGLEIRVPEANDVTRPVRFDIHIIYGIESGDAENAYLIENFRYKRKAKEDHDKRDDHLCTSGQMNGESSGQYRFPANGHHGSLKYLMDHSCLCSRKIKIRLQ